MKQLFALILVLVILTGFFPQATILSRAEENTPAATGLEGKTLSILGDSISTYTGVSNHTAYNSTIGKNAIYYTAGKWQVYQADTWWQQAIDTLGLELLVNNSWSGSCIFNTRSGTVGAYVDRCIQLHNNTASSTGEDPDIIAVYLGTNDYYNYPSTMGSFEAIHFDELITKTEDAYTYSTPATCLEAYAILLHKISQRYPNAELYCFTLLPRRASTSQPTAFNEDVCQLAGHFGAYPVDLYNCGVFSGASAFDILMGDSLHPNPYGMDAITNAFLSALYKNSRYVSQALTTYDVTFSLTNAVSKQGTAMVARSDAPFTVELAPVSSNYTLNVTVTMDGQDVTSDCYSNGRVSIQTVTGDIAITAIGKELPPEPEENPVIDRDLTAFRWEYDANTNQFVSITDGFTENIPNMTHGSISSGTFSGARFTLSSTIYLNHDNPWEVEWKSSGTWGNDGALLFSEDNTSSSGGRYFYRRYGNRMFALGVYENATYKNYAVEVPNLDTGTHIFRLVNQIEADGTNMVYLYIDDSKIGALNQYYTGGTDKNTSSNWVCGKNFQFNFMGTTPHTITGCKLEYVQVWECVHSYQDGACIHCGKDHPNLKNLDGKVISILGDSISTFAGYIPTADGFNLEHLARYPQDNLLTDVNETWWMQTIQRLHAKLGINDSWRGATVSGDKPVTSGVSGEKAAMANLQRIRNLGANGTPDVILFYGGTNDIAHVSKIGSFDPALAPTAADLTTAKWDNLADGYVHTLLRLKHYYPNAQIIALLPTYTASYYSNEKLAQANAVLSSICTHYGVAYVDLRESGIGVDDLPDGIHPDATGMDYITAAVMDTVLSDCHLEAGENVVFPVSHSLQSVTASFGYYKGVSAGMPFTQTLSTDGSMTVTVTMGGQDITASCYQDGVISIPAVTGEISIWAQAQMPYLRHLQALPEYLCSKTNLWAILEHDPQYYTAGGWGVHASGQVYSATIPVTAGDRLWATSFQAAGSNGGTIPGIRVTFFGEDGSIDSLPHTTVHSLFAQDGYLTVPEGAVAVNIPMWTVSQSNELFILNRQHSYEQGICSSCGEVQSPVAGWSLTLGDDIGMNFLIQIHEALADQTSVQITVADGDTVTYPLSEYTPEENGSYLLRVCVAAAQMTDTVKLQVFVGDTAGQVYTYSVQQYAKAVLADESLSRYHPLVKEMLNYGAAAQAYFAYNLEKPIDEALYEGAGIYAIDDFATPGMAVSGRLSGCRFYGASLLHRSYTALRFYFSGSDLSGYTFTAGNTTLTPVQKDGLWYVEIADILPQQLDEATTVTIVCPDGSMNVSYSPMDYILRQNQTGSQSLQSLLKALYNYHLAAKAL